MIDEMRRHLVSDFPRGGFERAGNTKTHGLVRGELTIHDEPAGEPAPRTVRDARDLPLLGALFRPGPAYRARHRRRRLRQHQRQGDGRCGRQAVGRRKAHAGLHRGLHADLRDAGRQGQCAAAILEPPASAGRSISSISRGPHLLDFMMQGLWNETQTNPLGAHLLLLRALSAGAGPGDAVQLLAEDRGSRTDSAAAVLRPRRQLFARQHGPHARRDGRRVRNARAAADRPVPDADREQRGAVARAAVAARAGGDACEFRGRSSTTPTQFAFTRNLRFNPWHCLPEHRPLGNQSRARKRMYDEMANFRQKMNGVPHIEPTGDECSGACGRRTKAFELAEPLSGSQSTSARLGRAGRNRRRRSRVTNCGKPGRVPAVRAGAGPRKAVGALRLVCDRAARKRLAIAEQRILLAGQASKFRAGDPGALNEFELARDVGVEAQEVETGLRGRASQDRAPPRNRSLTHILGRGAGCGESGPRPSHRPRIESRATPSCCAARAASRRSGPRPRAGQPERRQETVDRALAPGTSPVRGLARRIWAPIGQDRPSGSASNRKPLTPRSAGSTPGRSSPVRGRRGRAVMLRPTIDSASALGSTPTRSASAPTHRQKPRTSWAS